MPSSTALAAGPRQASIPKTNPPEHYVLQFAKNQYTVPQSAIKSFPKRPNEMPSGEALGQLLATKAPKEWIAYCHPDTLCKIQGEDGSTCIYTTFSVPGAPNERRFLRLIAAQVAEAIFETIEQSLADEIAKIDSERQQIRYDVLKWKKKDDCPNRAQLLPELEKWQQLAGHDIIKSVARKPEAKKRPKPGQSPENEVARLLGEFVVDQSFVKKPKNSTCKIIETDNVVHVLFYKHLESGMDDDPEDI